MIGVSPQEINLDKFLTVEETMLFHAGYYGVPKEKAKRGPKSFSALRPHGEAQTRVNTLSGGMKRRVLFARALMHDPKVLFLDEPTAGVDVELRYKLWGYIRELNRGGLTILLRRRAGRRWRSSGRWRIVGAPSGSSSGHMPRRHRRGVPQGGRP